MWMFWGFGVYGFRGLASIGFRLRIRLWMWTYTDPTCAHIDRWIEREIDRYTNGYRYYLI